MATNQKPDNKGLVKTLSSLQFGIVILITIALVAVIGTLIPQGRPFEFYSENYNRIIFSVVSIFRFDRTYSSPLFIGLLGLFGINLILCSVIKFPRLLLSIFRPNIIADRKTVQAKQIHVELQAHSMEEVRRTFSGSGFQLRVIDENHLFGEKWKIGYLGATIVHVSLLVLLAGGVVSLLTGVRGHIKLEKGETASALVLPDGSEIPLGFSVRLDEFNVSFYESHPGRPKSYTSSVTVTDGNGTVSNKDIQVNHPLMLNGFNIYQSSYGLSEQEMQASAENDTARVEISLKGAPEGMPPITTVDMVKGGEFLVPGFGDSIKVVLTELFRDFRSANSSVNIDSPAVELDIRVNDESRWHIFAFRNFPGLNMPVYDDIDLAFAMIDLKVNADTSGHSGDRDYYTVLGVVRDKGVPVMFAGAFLMMAGLFISFYVRPKRLWVLEENGTIHIGAVTKGDPDQFRHFISKTVKKLHRGNKPEKNNEPDN